MVYNNKPQYNNNYPKKDFSNSSDSNSGTAKITSTKKSGCILEIVLNNQNLVLKGFWDNRNGGWKLFPYYDKTKTNPAFNKPNAPTQQMDDQLPKDEQEWSQGSGTSFDPNEYEAQLSNKNDYK
tara:strand:+ start:1712 stop:2083 length:372 start_codon:yes stop_codon:yes gene_type:complete